MLPLLVSGDRSNTPLYICACYMRGNGIIIIINNICMVRNETEAPICKGGSGSGIMAESH